MTKIPEKMISVTAYALREAPNCSYETLASLALEAAGVAELIEKSTALSNFAWTAVRADCLESHDYLNALLADLRIALAKASGSPPDDARAAHRAAVEAGYASLDGYVERYGRDGE